MATMKTLNGYGFNATELNGKTSDSYLQLGDDGTGSTGEAPALNAGTFGGMTVRQFVDMIYPVGSIYMSASATSPSTLFGGTWESIGGRFLLGADATYVAGSTGGEAEHTLTNNELPRITGSMVMRAVETQYNTILSASGAFNTSLEDSQSSTLAFKGSGKMGRLNMSFGGNAAHNNMPPYLAVYMWQRTA